MIKPSQHALLVAIFGVTVGAMPLSAQAQIVPAAAPAQQGFTAKTKLGVLMDNPATMAVLRKHVPEVMAEKEIGKGRNYSLRFISGFDKRLKAALPAIERDLAAIPYPAAGR